MKHIKLFENFEENKLDIPYQFIEEIKDLLTEYEDRGMVIFVYVLSYVNEYTLYSYLFNKYRVIRDEYNQNTIHQSLNLYQEDNIPLNKFVYHININHNKELSTKFINRLKQIYPNINTDVSSHDVKWDINDDVYNLNRPKNDGIYFILE